MKQGKPILSHFYMSLPAMNTTWNAHLLYLQSFPSSSTSSLKLQCSREPPCPPSLHNSITMHITVLRSLVCTVELNRIEAGLQTAEYQNTSGWNWMVYSSLVEKSGRAQWLWPSAVWHRPRHPTRAPSTSLLYHQRGTLPARSKMAPHHASFVLCVRTRSHTQHRGERGQPAPSR